MTDVLLKRFASDSKSTIGQLYVDGLPVCKILEDAYHEEKIPGITRIPAGRYRLKLRRVGGFHSRYKKRFKGHVGMIQICDVPNYKYILIHCGNTADSTEGCLITGTTHRVSKKSGYVVGASAKAYEKMYPTIAPRLDNGEELYITIFDNDLPSQRDPNRGLLRHPS